MACGVGVISLNFFKIYKNEICPFHNQKALSSFISVACKVLWYTVEVLLAKLVQLCPGFTKLTILREGLAKTAKLKTRDFWPNEKRRCESNNLFPFLMYM